MRAGIFQNNYVSLASLFCATLRSKFNIMSGLLQVKMKKYVRDETRKMILKPWQLESRENTSRNPEQYITGSWEKDPLESSF